MKRSCSAKGGMVGEGRLKSTWTEQRPTTYSTHNQRWNRSPSVEYPLLIQNTRDTLLRRLKRYQRLSYLVITKLRSNPTTSEAIRTACTNSYRESVDSIVVGISLASDTYVMHPIALSHSTLASSASEWIGHGYYHTLFNYNFLESSSQ
jgi:hypothetical protein